MTIETKQVNLRRVAFLLDNLNGGGAERVVFAVASGFSDLGYEVDLLVCELRGSLYDDIPDGVNLVVLEPAGRLVGLWAALSSHWSGVGKIVSYIASIRKIPRSFGFISAISKYLQAQRPAVLLAVLPKSNINAMLAVTLAGVETRVFLGAQIFMSRRHERGLDLGRGQFHHMIPLLRHCYSRAEGIIATSRGVAEDAVAFLGLNPERVHLVYNPVYLPGLEKLMDEPVQHPWFLPGSAAVLVGIGRLVEQKNFPLLVEAFARVRRRIDARLVIIGGDESSRDQMAHRQELQSLAAELGVSDDVELIGYRSNPFPYLKAASAFVLSSHYEGFGNVLIEAMLAGCPVVSTDCPSGPYEILDGGRYGILVPVNDIHSLSEGILASLATEPESDKLRQRGREFSLESAVAGYHQIFFSTTPDFVTNESGRLSPVNPTS